MPKVIHKIKSNFTYISFSRLSRIIGFSASAVLTVIMTLTVFPIQERTSTAEATTGTATESSTTITVNQATASIDLTAASADGTFAKSEGDSIASFGVKTTNYTGYTLTVKASDNDGTLTNTSGQGSFTTISEVLDEKTFDTASYNGKWGYKPSKYNSIDNVAYWPSPKTTPTTLDVTKEANSTDNTYTIALGARAAYTQPTGTYSKTVSLTATANQANYSIDYTDNTGDATVKNIPDDTNSTTSATTINLSSVVPSRTGYVFAGWCSVAPTSQGTSCGGTTYPAGSAYGIDQTTTNIITLYATWTVPKYTITIKPSTGITSVSLNGTSCTNTSGCTVQNLTYGQSYTLTATAASGYSFAAYSVDGAGTVANIQSASTNYTVGEGTGIITAVGAGADAKQVTVNFAAAGSGTVGVSSVTFTKSSTGVSAGTVSTSGGKVTLEQGVGYTITVTPKTNYGVASYKINNSSNGTLASTGAGTTTYFTPNAKSGSAVLTVTSCIKTISGTMQTYTTAINQLCDDATGTLTDNRDSKTYKVGVVTANNGATAKALWMTQNLSIGCKSNGAINSITLTSAKSNVSTNYTTPTTSGHSADYNNGKIVCSDNADYGAWYNYAAATAGTITGDFSTSTSTYDICPKGWQLASRPQMAAAASNTAAFVPVAGGTYLEGGLSNTAAGYWWTKISTENGISRYNITYNSTYLYTGYEPRTVGFYVRCVRS